METLIFLQVDNVRTTELCRQLSLAQACMPLCLWLLVISETNSKLTVEEAKGMRSFTFSILLMFGVVSLSIVLRNVCTQANADNRRTTHFWDQKYLRLIFMWIFGVACLVDTILYLLETISVFNEYKSAFFWSICVVCASLLVTFLIIQTILLSISKRHYIISGIKLRYGLVMTILCNAGFWVYCVGNESIILQNGSNNGTQSDDFKSNTSIFTKWSQFLDPITSPMAVEYTLMSLFSIFEFLRMQHDSSDVNEEMHTVLGSYDQIGESFSEADPILPFRSPSRWKAFLFPTIMGLFLTVPLLVLEIYISVKTTITEYEPVYAVYESYWVANHLTNLLLSLIGLYILASSELSRLRGNTRMISRIEDFTLLLCCLGVQMIHVFGFYGNIMNKPHLVSHVVILSHCLSFFETLLQTMLIIQASASLSNLQTHSLVMKNILLTIGMINFALWISNSFVKHIRVFSILESNFYGDYFWNVVSDVLYPLAIFYRFHSAFECYNLYGKI